MKNLSPIFDPKSIALIGATDREGSVGLGIAKNLLTGKEEREIFFVNPNREEVLGEKTYPSVKDIEQEIDLAIIAVPAKVVPKVAKECTEKKVKGAIIISAGFAEVGKEGEKRQEKVKKIFQEKDIPLIGPNCLGVIIPPINLNASFAPATPKTGSIAFLSQSGALVDSVVDKSLLEGYGFSGLVSFGNQADVEVCDLLDFFGKDERTKAITLYLEGLDKGRKFIEKASEVSQRKPIIALKAGVSESGKEAVGSHTGSLAGNSEVYEAAFKKAGIFQVDTLQGLLDTSLALAWQQPCENNIAIVTNGGACGVMTTDWCEKYGVNLVELEEETLDKLEDSEVMSPAFSKRNPLDIVGDASEKRYRVAIEALLEQENIKGLIVIQTLQVMTDPEENAKVIVEAQRKWKEKPILPCFVGGEMTKKGVKILLENKIPNFSEPQRAALAMKSLIYRNKLK